MNYTPVVAGLTCTGATCAALALPNTGSNAYLTVALAIGAGLLTWGVLYARGR